jgi:hypothetical protein
LSFTVTLKEQVAVKPAPSIALQITVLVPLGNDEPLVKLGDTIATLLPQLSEDIGVA